MAEQIRGYFEILDELFFNGNESALEKYAKVRFTQYEMSLWREYGLPLREVSFKAKRHFNDRFLGPNIRIEEANEAELSEAFKKLKFAVGRLGDEEPSGCHKRCLKLVNELNEALKMDGLDEVQHAEKFLDYLTFHYRPRTDFEGRPLLEKPYNFEIRVFDDEKNRRDFRMVIDFLRKEKREMSMQDIFKMIHLLNRYSISVQKKYPSLFETP